MRNLMNFEQRYEDLKDEKILTILSEKYGLTKKNKFKGYTGASNKHRLLVHVINPMWRLKTNHISCADREYLEIDEHEVYQYIKNANYGLNFYLEKTGETYPGVSFEDDDQLFLDSYGCSIRYMQDYVNGYMQGAVNNEVIKQQYTTYSANN
jgi:hypothetical protein